MAGLEPILNSEICKELSPELVMLKFMVCREPMFTVPKSRVVVFTVICGGSTSLITTVSWQPIKPVTNPISSPNLANFFNVAPSIVFKASRNNQTLGYQVTAVLGTKKFRHKAS